MTNFNNKPFVEVKKSFDVWKGWDGICTEINNAITNIVKDRKVIVIETYQGVMDEELIQAFQAGVTHDRWINATSAMKSEDEVKNMVYPDVTDDRIFGALSRLNVTDYYDQRKIGVAKKEIQHVNGIAIIYGVGATLYLIIMIC